MYIKRVRIENVRCCKDLDLNFDKPGSSLLISGDNGDGKSTVLRSLSMGLCDESSAAGLLRELPGDFVRKGADSAKIIVHLGNTRGVTYEIETTIKSLKAFERVTQRVSRSVGKKKTSLTQDNFPWDNIFVSAYGAGTRTKGTDDYQHYVAVDAVYPLFRYDVPMQNPELAFRRFIEDARKRGGNDAVTGEEHAKEMEDYLCHLLQQILNLDNKKRRVFLGSSGIEIKIGDEGRRELGALGDGYRSTTTLFFDLISWWMLHLKRKSYYENRDIRGIVLIDEVEQHLHPRWQLAIMRLLKDTFPKLQFIIATHSPLVISGSEGVGVIRLDRGDNTPLNVSGWLAEDVYREILGLPTTRPKFFINETIDEYRKLHERKLNNKLNKAGFKKLTLARKKLMNFLPPDDPLVVMIELENLTKRMKSKKGE